MLWAASCVQVARIILQGAIYIRADGLGWAAFNLYAPSMSPIGKMENREREGYVK